jgi:hypothetical protein
MNIYVRHCAEVIGLQGPTGELVEVLEGKIQDYGGNVLFSGTADECVKQEHRYRIPIRRIPTVVRHHLDTIAEADHHWTFAPFGD